MKNCYEILGTNYEAIYYRGLKESDSEIDEFLRDKYEYAKKLLEAKKNNAKSEERLQELEEQAKNLMLAYEQIKSPIQREIYNRELEEEKYQKILGDKGKTGNVTKRKTAYHILNILPETLIKRDNKENDDFIKRKKDQLVKRYSEMLENTTNFSEKSKIELEIRKINEAYELIKNAKKREEYSLYLKREHEKEMEKIRKEEIKNKYSHQLECDLTLIANGKKINGGDLVKKVIKEPKKSLEHIYVDQAKRQLRVKQSGIIVYETSGGLKSSIDEYLITRKINGVEKSDIIYTNLAIIKLSRNKITQKICDPEYYDCVVNQLLSEDTIEGAQYNYGYIGDIEQDENGKYHITLGNKILKPSEKEALTAVMIIKNQERENETQIEEVK